MRKLLIIIVVLALAVIGVDVALLAKADRPFNQKQSKPISQNMLLADISKQCAESIDTDGFGVATIRGNLRIVNQSGDIDVDCRIRLLDGANLALVNSQLSSQKLLVIDNPAAARPSRLDLNKAKLSSNAGGIQISLKSRGSRVNIKNSQLNYPLSVGVTVGADDERAALTAVNSQLSSLGESSEGIVLVSTGKAVFSDSQFKLSRTDDVALLLAPDCRANRNVGADLACKSS